MDTSEAGSLTYVGGFTVNQWSTVTFLRRHTKDIHIQVRACGKIPLWTVTIELVRKFNSLTPKIGNLFELKGNSANLRTKGCLQALGSATAHVKKVM